MRIQKWFTILIIMAALLVAVPAFAQGVVVEEPVELSVTGIIDAISGTTLTVDGLDYDVAAAEITAVGMLAIGDTVSVLYFVEDEANIAISVIEDEADDDDEEPVEELTVSGKAESIIGSIITVGGVGYDTSSALIRARGMLAIGDTVAIVYVVEADVNIALSLAEDEVIVDDEDDDDGSAPDHSRQYGVGSKCEAEAPDGWVVYTVDDGDTLWSLAVATGASIAQLKFPNCIGNPHDIAAGDVVFLPSIPDPDAEPVHPGRGRNKDKRGNSDENTEDTADRTGNGRGNNGNGNGGNGNSRGNGNGNGNGRGNNNGTGKNK